MCHEHRKAWLGVLAVSGMFVFTSCLPYAMGSTAATTRPNELAASTIVSAVRLSDSSYTSSQRPSALMYDLEFRTGIDDRSDMGLRITSFTGVVGSYKRRLLGDETRGGLAFQVEGGVVNTADHIMGGISLVGSGNEYALVSAFGGLRVLAVAPIVAGAVRDQATIGGFLGARLDFLNFNAFPEMGVFYDRSALNLRKTSVLFIPSISIRRTGRGMR